MFLIELILFSKAKVDHITSDASLLCDVAITAYNQPTKN